MSDTTLSTPEVKLTYSFDYNAFTQEKIDLLPADAIETVIKLLDAECQMRSKELHDVNNIIVMLKKSLRDRVKAFN
jgi:hypothetical protein